MKPFNMDLQQPEGLPVQIDLAANETRDFLVQFDEDYLLMSMWFLDESFNPRNIADIDLSILDIERNRYWCEPMDLYYFSKETAPNEVFNEQFNKIFIPKYTRLRFRFTETQGVPRTLYTNIYIIAAKNFRAYKTYFPYFYPLEISLQANEGGFQEIALPSDKSRFGGIILSFGVTINSIGINVITNAGTGVYTKPDSLINLSVVGLQPNIGFSLIGEWECGRRCKIIYEEIGGVPIDLRVIALYLTDYNEFM